MQFPSAWSAHKASACRAGCYYCTNYGAFQKHVPASSVEKGGLDATVLAGLYMPFLSAFNTSMNVFMARVQNVERILRLENERMNELERDVARFEEAYFQREAGE
jgi:hypothetical protein